MVQELFLKLGTYFTREPGLGAARDQAMGGLCFLNTRC